MSNTVTLRISRSAQIEKNYNVALMRLDSMNHVIGQPVMVRYYTDEPNDEIRTIVVIGVRNGFGRDCYSVISVSDRLLVNGILDELPDEVDLVNGGVYITKHNGEWCIFYSTEGTRSYSSISNTPFKIYDMSTGYGWYYINGDFKREDDFVSESQNKRELEKSLNQVKNPTLIVDYLGEDCVELGTVVEDPEFAVYVTDYSGKDITDKVRIFVDFDTLEDTEVIPTNNRFYIPGNFNKTEKVSFTAIYETEDFLVSSNKVSTTLYFQPPVYYAKVSSLDSEPETIASLLWNGQGKLTLPNRNLNSEYIKIWIPSNITLDSIYDNKGLGYLSDYEIIENIEKEGQLYTLYKGTKAITANDYIQTLVSTEGVAVLISSSDKNSVLREIRNTVKAEIKSEILLSVLEELNILKTYVDNKIEEDLDAIRTYVNTQIDASKTETATIIQNAIDAIMPIYLTMAEYLALVEAGEIDEDREYCIYEDDEEE